jgi:hypothetical protein
MPMLSQVIAKAALAFHPQSKGADVCAISPPTDLVPLCNTEGFSPQKIKLPSGSMNDQAIFLGHERDPSK